MESAPVAQRVATQAAVENFFVSLVSTLRVRLRFSLMRECAPVVGIIQPSIGAWSRPVCEADGVRRACLDPRRIEEFWSAAKKNGR